MNSTNLTQLEELITLTQLYLLQEYSERKFVNSSLEDYLFFKKIYGQKPIAETPQPIPTKVSEPLFLSKPTPKVNNPVPVSQAPIPLPSAPLLNQSDKKLEQEQLSNEHFKRQKRVELSPQKEIFKVDLSDIRKVMQEELPQQKILDCPPDDALAREMAKKWSRAPQTPSHSIAIVIKGETPSHQTFLENVANALRNYYGKVNLIDQDQEWESLLTNSDLNLLIASKISLQCWPILRKFYHKDRKTGRDLLGKIPLYILTDISLYLREPKQKAILWKELREWLKTK